MSTLKRVKKINKPFSRKLSDSEKSYLEELEIYNKVLSTTVLISHNQHGIPTSGRGIRGIKIFTRQTLVGMSLLSILPHPSTNKHKEEDFWDICSIASLSRNIMEGYISLYYFGTEDVSEEDAELRFFFTTISQK